MNRTKKLLMSSLLAAALGLAATAQAQDSPPPSPPPSSGGGGGGSPIIGGGTGAGIGVGAAVILSNTGIGGFPTGQFVYDMAMLHFEGLFGFTSAENGAGDRVSNLVFGAGGWYHLHRGSSSDFSLGALIAINTNTGPGPSTTVTAFEPGATVRAFLTPNVALFARAGLVFLFGDTGNGTNIALGGQPAGSFGFTYFFR
jgi:hypothetical protein